MGGVLNNSTALNAEGTNPAVDDMEVAGPKRRYVPLRMLEAGLDGKEDADDGSDEQPMTEQEEARRREREDELDVGRGADWVQGIWASDPANNEPPPSTRNNNKD